MDDSYPPIKRAAWHQLDDDAYALIWEQFQARFKFERSRDLAEPVIRDPSPSITFDLSSLGGAASHAASLGAINAESLRCFVSELTDVEHLVVLDWQHPAFRFDPRLEALDLTPRDPINGYPTVYPDGDYHAFLTPDFREGTFGHPWEPSLCVIGQRLIDTLGASLATWLPVKRESIAR